MTAHRRYEFRVAAHFQEQGYRVTVSPGTSDYGLDVLAEKDSERIAIQAKLYGHTSRQVNRQVIMELRGVQSYFDCDRAVLVTDGRIRADAQEVARKIGVELLHLPAEASRDAPEEESSASQDFEEAEPRAPELTSDQVWSDYIMPLAGHTLSRIDGTTNRILAVDWSGVERMTSNGRTQKINYEIFRLAINHLFARGSITRDEINQNYLGRASSGVILILSQVPFFRLERRPIRLVFDADSLSNSHAHH